MNSDRAICMAEGQDNESLHPCRGFSLISADLNFWSRGGFGGGWGGAVIRKERGKDGEEKEEEDEHAEQS